MRDINTYVQYEVRQQGQGQICFHENFILATTVARINNDEKGGNAKLFILRAKNQLFLSLFQPPPPQLPVINDLSWRTPFLIFSFYYLSFITRCSGINCTLLYCYC